MLGFHYCTGFSLAAESRGYSLAAVHGLLIAVVSLITEHSSNSCGVGVKLLHSMWDLPSPGMEPASPALTGRFFTTEILGKPWKLFLSVTSH